LYALPKTSSETIFDIDALVNDPLLIASFQETLRLRTQHGSTRLVIQSTTIPVHGKEYYIREGSIVFMPVTLIHKDPHIYSDVNEYKPERFLSTDDKNLMIITSDTKEPNGKSSPSAFSKNNHSLRHYFMPFGGGESLVSMTLNQNLRISVQVGDLLKTISSYWQPQYCICLNLRILNAEKI
jgi:cytochrome P450